MTTDSNISFEDILKIIEKKISQEEKIQDIIDYCEQWIISFPENEALKNKLEYLHDLAQSEAYLWELSDSDDGIDLDKEFERINSLESKKEILEAYKKLQKKFPSHKWIEEGIKKYSVQWEDSVRWTLVQMFREITQMKWAWWEPDYEWQKAKLLALKERYPFHEGIEIALSTLEEWKKNNFRID